MTEDKYYVSYNSVHKVCQQAAHEIMRRISKPDVIVAISGGGLIPSRMLRTFLKKQGEQNIPIQAIGLSLYEPAGDEEKIGKEVVRTQWLDFGALEKSMDSLIGKNILIVDEVDDTRTTLHYALTELFEDIEKKAKARGETMCDTKFSIFVVHNKLKPKRVELDKSLMNGGIYLAGKDVEDQWIAYPWDSDDIDDHTKKAYQQGH